MSEWRRYGKARRDESEPEVIAAFRAGGATPVQHSGRNEPDLFIAYRGRWYAIEVKTGNRKRTPEQQKWADKQAAPVEECRNEAQAKARMRTWDEERRREIAAAVEAREDEDRKGYADNQKGAV